MNILHVVPLAKLPKNIPPIISYFSRRSAKEGALVSVLINRRPVIALVLKTENISKQKVNIKKLGFALKNIKKIIYNHPILSDKQLEIISFVSQELCLAPNLLLQTALKWLPKDSEKIPTFIEKSGFNFSPPNKKVGPQFFKVQNFYGKDRMEKYAPIIEKTLKEKSVLIIAPSATYAEYFYSRLKEIFTEKIFFLNPKIHSRKVYSDLFFSRNPSPKLIVSTKLAILAPWTNVGLVILEKETANFYNFEHKKYIDFKRAILHFAEIYNIPCLLADDIPSIESYHKFKDNSFELKTPEILNQALLKKISFIDLGQEKKLDKNSFISQRALSIISDCLHQEKKLIVFINKKGYSKSTLCGKCGLILMCPRCGLNFSAEKNSDQKIGLFCKNCFLRQPLPKWCPGCEFSSWKFIGAGTERLEGALKNSFPKTPIFRLDKKCAPDKKSFEKIVNDFESAKSGILIATCIIFNQPNLKADNVLIVSSDTAFFVPDYSGTEKILNTFIELENFSKEKVFWQTYQKNHPSTLSFYNKTFENFAESELKLRQQFNFPPFSKIIKIRSSLKNSFLAKRKLEDFAQNIKFEHKDLIGNSIFLSSLQNDKPFLDKNHFSYIIEMKVILKNDKNNPVIIFDILREAQKMDLEADVMN